MDISAIDGGRVRIGLIVPSVNTVVEPLFAAALPERISVHTARMFLAPILTAEAIIDMDRSEGERAIQQIASCRPATIAYCCTASSIVQGQLYDERLRSRIEDQTGARATTATHAILTALGVFGASKICVASPYDDHLDEMERQFFSDRGLAIVSSANLGISDSYKLADPDRPALIELCERAWNPDADAMVVTCLNTSSHLIVEAVEAKIGKPVITSTTATLWQALRMSGIKDDVAGGGVLFRQA